MNTTLKSIVTVIVSLVIGFGIGYFMFHGQYLAGGISPVNTLQTNGTQSPSVSISTAVAGATSTSIFNNQNDRAITSLFAYCTGASSTIANASAFTVTVSTSSIGSFNSTTATIATLTISSSTPQTYATSTNFTAGAGYWPGSTYLQYNFNATNTAVCTVGANTLQL